MFEYYNNILCVNGGWLYGGGQIMSKPNYKALLRRDKITRLCVGGNGRKSWIAYESIPDRFKEAIKEVIKGDPYEKVKYIVFRDYIEDDYKAETFFRDYTLENGEALPDSTQREYTDTAKVLNACHVIVSSVIIQRKFGGKKQVWERLAKAIAHLPGHTYKCKLPRNPRILKQKYLAYKGIKLTKRYNIEGYEGLIHGNFLNVSAQKLNEDACRWSLARWSNQVDKCVNLAQLHSEYNEIADDKGWKYIKDEKTFYNFLYNEEIQPLWYGHRYGELAYKEKYGYQFKTKLPTMRDSLWYSDGTKLNYYYLTENGKMATCQVYEVMDVFSEVLLGYFISNTEDYTAQYASFKMAIQTAGYRPYQIAHDNQGGHKKLKSGDFLTKVARVQTATKPYNGKSKTIENAFYRLQSQFLKRDWFFTGQNITTNKQESKANMEFILANQASLPSLDEIKAKYAQRRREWNEAPHPLTGKPRIEMYLDSQNKATKKVELWDMVDLFWITRQRQTTCDAQGVSFTEKKAEYFYMVYKEDGMPDIDWLEKSIGKKFTVKFDPDDTSMIMLYEDTPLGLRFVTQAETKKEIHRGIQEQEEWEASYIHNVINANDAKRIERRDEMEELLAEHGMTAEQQGLRIPTIKGLERRKKGRKAKTETFGSYQKKVSNQDWNDEEEMVKISIHDRI